MVSTLRAVLLAALAASGGCRAASAPTPVDAGSRAVDRGFAPRGSVTVQRLALHRRLAFPPASSFARLAPAARALLERLLQRELTSTADVLGARMLVELAPGHPAAGYRLLLADDRDALCVIGKRRVHRLPRTALPDVLDLVDSPSQRGAFEATAARVRWPDNAASQRRLRCEAREARVGLRYRPRAGHAGWTVKVTARFLAPATATPLAPPPEPLLQLMLPLLHARRGQPILEALAFRSAGAPLRWRVAVDNESLGEEQAFETDVRRVGLVRVPLARFRCERAGLPTSDSYPAVARRRDGMQAIAGDKLAGLRQSGATAELEVRNRAARAALVFVDGIFVGWVAPGRRFAFSGLPHGFYRVFAASPSGVRAWGPRDVYVPGPTTLE